MTCRENSPGTNVLRLLNTRGTYRNKQSREGSQSLSESHSSSMKGSTGSPSDIGRSWKEPYRRKTTLPRFLSRGRFSSFIHSRSCINTVSVLRMKTRTRSFLAVSTRHDPVGKTPIGTTNHHPPVLTLASTYSPESHPRYEDPKCNSFTLLSRLKKVEVALLHLQPHANRERWDERQVQTRSPTPFARSRCCSCRWGRASPSDAPARYSSALRE